MTEFSILEMIFCVCLNIVRKEQESKRLEKRAKNKEPEKETLEILFQGHSHCIVAFVLLIYYQVHVLTDTSQTQDS